MQSIPEQIRDLFLQDSIRKNMRIHFPNGENRDLTNEDIVMNTAKFTESTSSNGELKLGIAEASMFEVDVVGVKKIKGCEIDVSLEIDISSLGNEFIQEYGSTSDDVSFPFYSISYGRFIVYEYKQKAESLIASIIAYDALALKVLHVDIRPDLRRIFANSTGYRGLKKIFYYLLPESDYNDVTISEKTQDYTVTKEIKTKKSGVYRNSDIKYDEYRQGLDFYAKAMLDAWYTQDVIEYEEIIISFTNQGTTLNNKLLVTGSVDTDDGGYVAQREADRAYYHNNHGNYYDYTLNISPPYAPTSSQYPDYVWRPYTETFIFNRVIGYKVYTYTYHAETGYQKNTYPSISPTDYSDITTLSGAKTLISRTFPNFNVDISNLFYQDVYSPSSFLTNGSDLFIDYNKLANTPNVYLTDLMDAIAKVSGLLCRINKRTKEIDFYRLYKSAALYPRDDLYPDDTLFPFEHNAKTYYRGEFSECDYEDYLTKPIGRVIIKITKDEVSAQVKEFNEYDYSTIEVDTQSDNTFFQCIVTTDTQNWQSKAKIILDTLSGITFRPFDGEFIGLPYMEAGDSIRVQTVNGFFDTYIMRRTLSGVQSLTDSLEAIGDE